MRFFSVAFKSLLLKHLEVYTINLTLVFPQDLELRRLFVLLNTWMKVLNIEKPSDMANPLSCSGIRGHVIIVIFFLIWKQNKNV